MYNIYCCANGEAQELQHATQLAGIFHKNVWMRMNWHVPSKVNVKMPLHFIYNFGIIAHI